MARQAIVVGLGRFGISLKEDGKHDVYCISRYDKTSFGNENIPVELDGNPIEWRDFNNNHLLAIYEMVKPMIIKNEKDTLKAIEQERAAQSAHYTREPGRGGTGIDETIKKWGRWNLDTSTKAGRDIEKQSKSIQTVSSSDPIETTLEDLTFEYIKKVFTDHYKDVHFTRPQTGEPYYRDSINLPNDDDTSTAIGDTEALEAWKEKTQKKYGNVTILLKPKAENWFDKAEVTDDKFKAAMDKHGKAKKAWADKEMSKGRSIDENKIMKKIKEQATAGEDKRFQLVLKNMQKDILKFQINYYRKKQSKAASQAAAAASQAGKGMEDQIKGLQQQLRALDKPQKGGEKKKTNELLFTYMRERGNNNLMEHMDFYKKEILMEGAMKKLFSEFELGKTNEEVIQDYAKKGIQVPETFVSKVRGQFENYKKLKLELEMSEKAFKNEASKIVNNAEEELEIGEKKLSSKLFK